jgi:hypothetical protein
MINKARILEFWDYIRSRKKWYLLPLIVLLIILGSIIILSEGSAVAPFIYAIF